MQWRLMGSVCFIQTSRSAIRTCFVSDEFPEMGGPKSIGGTPVEFWLYVEDVDAVFQQAVDPGATARTPVDDAFWDDRTRMITDPFGHDWAIATRKEEMSEEEMRRRVEALYASSR